MNDLVVRSERVVLPDGVRAASIHIRDGRIIRVAPHDDTPAGVPHLDFRELMLLPGVVDTHVHMNDPGRTHWEGAEHATRAAAAGGVTTVIDMPLNSIPPTTTVAGLEAKRAALSGRCYVDVGFWGGVVPGNIPEIDPLARSGVLGFKCFLSPSGVDEFEHVTERDLRDALPTLAKSGLPLLVHAELPEKLLDPDVRQPRSYRTWLASRPPAGECAAIDMLIALAEQYRTAIHVVHLACADAVAALRVARSRGVPITAETCPHYLSFAAEDVPDGATAFKCAPPIREHSHRESLWRALSAGDIDLVASDHSPAPPEDKCLDSGDFLRAWGGIASLQIALAVMWTGAVKRGIPIERLVDWIATAPAHLARLTGRKGSLSPGADADLVAWDPDAQSIVDPYALQHRHSVTPYAGMTVRGGVVITLLRGQIIYRDGAVLRPPRGRMIGSAS